LRLLLDTHVVVWAFAKPDRLSANALEIISSEENSVFVSIVTPWELAIKRALRRIETPDDLNERLEGSRFELLPVTIRHTSAVAAMLHHHRDPFDRMLVAQAQIEGMTLVSDDRKLRRYPVSLVPASG
jgi:PIN domain nuclease of toxin-antitoxin system